MEKVQIKVKPEIDFDRAKSSKVDSSPNKIRISFPLLRTYPIANANGDSFDFEETKELYDTIDFGYINLEHEQWINVGTVIDSSFTEEEGYGKIICNAVLWRNTLKEYDITEEEIKEGKYQISMEVYFNSYYIMHGNRKIELPDAEDYLELVGERLEGEEVVRVINPSEYSGAALTENAADKTLDIEKVVASKLKKKKEIAMLDSARTPNYEGIEDINWDNVDKSLDAIVQGYYAQNPDAEPESEEEIPEQVGDMSESMKNWASQLSLLGEEEVETLDELLVLPVVNPSTYKLNRKALTAAARLASRISGISNDTLESVQNKIDSLIEEEFNEEVNANMYKEFETEEEFNNFKNDLKDSLLEDDEFISKATEGYVKEEEVLASIEEEEIDNIDDVVDKYKEVKEEFASYKEDIEKEKKLNKRKATLEDKGIDIEKLEASEEDIMEMSEKSFNLMVKSFEQAFENMAEASKDGKFDPTNFDMNNEDNDVSDDEILESL